MDPKPLYNFRYTITQQQIPEFLESLRVVQEDMIEGAVKIKQEQGFPEVRELLNRISKENPDG